MNNENLQKYIDNIIETEKEKRWESNYSIGNFIEDLKNIQIVCRNQEQVKNCLNYLKQLGLNVDYYDCENYLIVLYDTSFDGFLTSYELEKKYVEFYNKEFVKTLQKFIKEKREKKEKEKVEELEVAKDGMIIKINNRESEQKVYTIYSLEVRPQLLGFPDKKNNLGLVYATPEARDRAMFQLEIETKLKSIAERLNAGRKIDWENMEQKKFFFYYDYNEKVFDYDFRLIIKNQGTIYCLDKNFLNVAKQEIGEDNLIKYFKE